MKVSANHRPLSPHLQIYRPQITSVLSIMHRLTGLVLGLGGLFFAGGLALIAWAPAVLEDLRRWDDSLVMSWAGSIVVFFWLWAFFYHLLNGVRHIVWDTGRGFDQSMVTFSGWAVVVLSLSCTVGLCLFWSMDAKGMNMMGGWW